MRSGIFASSARWVLLAAAAASASGCLYHFSGGGLPSNIRTVAVLPFDNQTGEPALTGEVTDAVRSAVEARLGLRASTEANADAIVRGEITRYEPDLVLGYQTTGGTVDVTRR